MKTSTFISNLFKNHVFMATLFFGFALYAQAQDPLRFQKEVEQIGQKHGSATLGDDLTVFTGSSSIKMWKDLQAYFPDHQLINTGFGGSQTSDLIYFVNELIINYKPQKVFIYEGDNDIAAGKSVSAIMENTQTLVKTLKKKLPEIEIFLISAKPSISRWELKEQYLELNREFEEYSRTHSNVHFVDIWPTMLNEAGEPKKEIFLEDNLHMNKKGYDLWAEVIGKYLE